MSPHPHLADSHANGHTPVGTLDSKNSARPKASLRRRATAPTHTATVSEPRAFDGGRPGGKLDPSVVTSLRNAIVDLVRREQTPTLAAVARLPGASGTTNLVITGRNVVLWDGLSQEAISAIDVLQHEGTVRLLPTHPLVYIIEGVVLHLPLANQAAAVARGYKRAHWLPVVLVANG